MSRRRLNVVSSSSDDDDEPQQPPSTPQSLDDEVFEEAETETVEPMETLSPNPIPNIDVVTLDSSSTPSAATTTAAVVISDEGFVDVSNNLSPPPPPPAVVLASFVASDCAVNDCLRKLGLCLKREWLDSCILGLGSKIPGFAGFDDETKAKLCLGQFLLSDMNCIGAGVLPENVHDLHCVDLAGPFVLQVDEVINISSPLKERYKNVRQGIKRTLKLSMTDGVQHVFGLEYRSIPCKILEDLGPVGFKVVIRNVHVRRGLMMLVPEVLEVLGGSVEELEMARRRLVHEINKPTRGKRTRTGVLPPLSTRATHAAWLQNGISNDLIPLQSANTVQLNATNSTIHVATPFHENIQDANTVSRNWPVHPTGRESTEFPTMGPTDQHVTHRESAQHPISRNAAQQSTSAESADISTRGNSSLSTSIIQNEDSLMVDHVEHPFILCQGNELPFTYLASLLAKWATVHGNELSIQGKIKCFLTGVKGFQYKQRSTFDLRVYVDDGSLISEIMVHHNVVQKRIGYSPEEVSAALSSSDQMVFNDMKESLKQFQIFLINFEGTMILEMNKSSTVPVALGMNQGCPVSEAWLLLHRLKPVNSTSLVCQSDQSDVINLSP